MDRQLYSIVKHVISSPNDSRDIHRKHATIDFLNVFYHRIIVSLLMTNAVTLFAQNKSSDTASKLVAPSPWEHIIHFHGYIQTPPKKLMITDSLKFNGFKTVKRLTIQDFMRLTQAESDRHQKEMEAIYKPLIEEQEKINKGGYKKGLFRYNPAAGFMDPNKEPVELMNPNNERERDPDWDGK
ncbi:MAG: hypothetical protein ACP5F6_07180 [Microbacter sp.]